MPKIDSRFVHKKTPIFTSVIDNYEEVNTHVKKHILGLKEHYPEGVESNVKAWRSDWFTHRTTKVFDPLVNIMVSACEYVSDVYYNNFTEYQAYNFWVMVYDEGNYTEEHHHFPSEFSCVYYVDVDKGCAPLIIEGETIQPENGLLVLFPSILDHSVPETKGRRIAASGNFIQVQKEPQHA